MNAQQSLNFSQIASRAVANATDRSKVVASAVALSIVKELSLPTAPVEDPAMHYIQMVLPQLRNKLSAFNEGVVFDIRFSLEVIRQLWMTRYSAAFGSRISMFKPECSFIENFTGASHVISEDICTVLNEHQVAIGLLSAAASNIFQEMKTEAGSLL
jgi:hypothetical protein